ncbi:MAG: hypothetical protein ACREI3_07635 [Nitrospirales bacterium]
MRNQPRLQNLQIEKGTCYAIFAYDIGMAIDLDRADQRIIATKQREQIKHKSKAPRYLAYRPAPLRVAQEIPPLSIGKYSTSPTVELLLYDFGALSITYKIPIEGPFGNLLALSEDLYENPLLQADSRQRVEALLATIQDAVEKTSIANYVEDYVIFQIEAHTPSGPPVPWERYEQEMAQILRCERATLAEQEVRDATSNRISFGTDDVAIIDWNGALLFGTDMDDARAVLEFANVELLEMRILDLQLDNTLDQAYEALSKRLWTRFRWPGSFESDSTRIAELQVDSALLFERVTNTLKLLGDQYLARVYRLASQRFHLVAWDASILRKLQTLESIYGKMTDHAAYRRMEVLEWIIIVLIALSIMVSFVPGVYGAGATGGPLGPG